MTYGDPITAPFWEAAARRRLLIQRCRDCGVHQFYPRPFCLKCQSELVEWVEAAGTATIYSLTTVRVAVSPEFHPPYRVAVVQLDEGPRMLTNIIGGECRIGERVRVQWKERPDAPPLPVFEPVVTEPGPP
ncbi:MAG: OB-fold domain-containing protein [Terriglobales bacterium]